MVKADEMFGAKGSTQSFGERGSAQPGGSASSLKRRLSDRTMSATDRINLTAHEGWSPLRILISDLLDSATFMAFLSVMILLHMCLVVLETDGRRSGQELPFWMSVVSNVFLGCYAVESALRMFVARMAFPLSKWNMFDFCLVSVDIAGTLAELVIGNVPSVAVFRLFRVVRVIRVFRALTGFRELFMMLHGLAAAMKAIIWATVMIMVALVFWSLLGVELIQPLAQELHDTGKWDATRCERCPHAFKNVWSGLLTLLQTVLTGDSWGEMAIPLSEEYPLTLVFFMGSFVSVNLGIMNLIVAVIVDRAHQAREEDDLQKLVEKDANFKMARLRMGEMFKRLDLDGSGSLTADELVDGIDNEPEFANLLRLMDVSSEDLALVFKVLDHDNSGQLSYDEFCEQLYKMKTHDAHTLLVFVRHQVSQTNALTSDIYDLVSRMPGVQGTAEKRYSTFSTRFSPGPVEETESEGDSFGKKLSVKLREKKLAAAEKPSDPPGIARSHYDSEGSAVPNGGCMTSATSTAPCNAEATGGLERCADAKTVATEELPRMHEMWFSEVQEAIAKALKEMQPSLQTVPWAIPAMPAGRENTSTMPATRESTMLASRESTMVASEPSKLNGEGAAGNVAEVASMVMGKPSSPFKFRDAPPVTGDNLRLQDAITMVIEAPTTKNGSGVKTRTDAERKEDERRKSLVDSIPPLNLKTPDNMVKPVRKEKTFPRIV